MTVKFLHIREIDEDENISPTGGVTIAYTVNENEGIICAAWVKCRPDELFCYATGREHAEARLKGNNPQHIEVLSLDHPVSNTLVDWLANDVWPSGPSSWGMGYAIDVDKDHRNRWVSDFIPSQTNITFTAEDFDETRGIPGC